MRVLSIDWDYFVEEDPMLDWGHRENNLFLEPIWDTRRTKTVRDEKTGKLSLVPEDLTKLVPFRGDEAFLRVVAFRCENYQIATAESHATILQLLENEINIEIINVDAHHDIHYGKMPKDRSEVDCGNWGSYLMQQDRIRSWRQCYPAWRTKRDRQEKFPKKFAVQNCRVSVEYGEPRISWRKIDLVFLCRSGCWTPPEYDLRFNKLCIDMGAEKGLTPRKITVRPPMELPNGRIEFGGEK